LTRTGLHRPSVSTARPVCTARPSISTARPVCTARPSISTARLSISIARPSINTARPSIKTARPVCTLRPSISTARPVYASRPIYPRIDNGNPEILLQDHAVVDSGCSSHMTGNKAYLSNYEDFNRGFVDFGSDPKGGKITLQIEGRQDDLVYSLYRMLCEQTDFSNGDVLHSVNWVLESH
ncbi:hypothetical protein Tco_0076729, partial [Tanacetum coccineum]